MRLPRRLPYAFLAVLWLVAAGRAAAPDVAALRQQLKQGDAEDLGVDTAALAGLLKPQLLGKKRKHFSLSELLR